MTLVNRILQIITQLRQTRLKISLLVFTKVQENLSRTTCKLKLQEIIRQKISIRSWGVIKKVKN
jgi:hypothetical protein